MSADELTVSLALKSDYEFLADFGLPGVPPLRLDEPAPTGHDRGPHAGRLLAAAIGNCLSASLLFCLRKARIEVKAMKTTVRLAYVRNEKGRRRVGSVSVRIEPQVAPGDEERMKRCVELFEDYCTVTASVRQGIQVDASVQTATG